jgi:hypothetical protein
MLDAETVGTAIVPDVTDVLLLSAVTGMPSAPLPVKLIEPPDTRSRVPPVTVTDTVSAEPAGGLNMRNTWTNPALCVAPPDSHRFTDVIVTPLYVTAAVMAESLVRLVVSQATPTSSSVAPAPHVWLHVSGLVLEAAPPDDGPTASKATATCHLPAVRSWQANFRRKL